MPGAGIGVWCRLCTCVSTRKEWTGAEGEAHPECPVCGAPEHETRLLTPDEFPEWAASGVPYPTRGRNPGYFARPRVIDETKRDKKLYDKD